MCQPKAAQCLICPLASHAAALEAGKVDEIPPPKPRPKKKLVEMQVGVSWSGKKLLLARRPDSGLFAKTMFPPEAESFPSSEEGCPLGEVRHQTTHRDVRVQVFAFPDGCKVSGAEWKHPDDPQLALTSLASKIIALAQTGSGRRLGRSGLVLIVWVRQSLVSNGSQTSNDGVFNLVKFAKRQFALVKLAIQQPFLGKVAND